MRILLPKTLLHEADLSRLFFLAGPIRGGGDWQTRAALMLGDIVPDCTIAVPCPWKEDHPLHKYRAAGDESRFIRQTPWERYYLEAAAFAAKQSCIIIWLPTESKDHPRDDGQPYARDTYGEIGEWRGRLMNRRDLRVAMGAEAGFPGLDVIEANFAHALPNRRLIIHTTLENTVNVAVRTAGLM